MARCEIASTQRTAIVGNNSADVGNRTATRKTGQRNTERPRLSGAMAQQCGDSGNQSAPQKLPQLVGCREQKAGPQAKPRAKPNSVQR
jgi:hypothetical protein